MRNFVYFCILLLLYYFLVTVSNPTSLLDIQLLLQKTNKNHDPLFKQRVIIKMFYIQKQLFNLIHIIIFVDNSLSSAYPLSH